MKKTLLACSLLIVAALCTVAVKAFSTTPNQVAMFDGSGNPTDSNAHVDTTNPGWFIVDSPNEYNSVISHSFDPNGYGSLASRNSIDHWFLIWQAGPGSGAWHKDQSMIYGNQVNIFADANIGGDGSVSIFTNRPGYWVDAPKFRFSPDGVFEMPTTIGAVSINHLQVVGQRKTGWGLATGTADRSTFDTATVTIEELARRVKALEDDLAVHGLIGN